MDIEVRAADGGTDAEMFAGDLSNALHRALKREGINFTSDDTVTTIGGKRPQWL